MEIYFATGNKHKYLEVKEMFNNENTITLKWFKFKHREIRSDSIEEIALEAVEKAYNLIKKPVFVDDTGLFLDAISGFPGTYSAWIQQKIGNKGILTLLKNKKKKERGAKFKSCIAFFDGKKRKTFFGSVSGIISEKILGKNGFGYDSIFIPVGYSKTFAQSIRLKKALSHRYKAITKLKKYIIK